MPPGVVVALLGALQASAIAVRVLASTALVVAVHALIRSVQALITLRTLAELVEVVALVHAVAAVFTRIRDGVILVVGDGVCRGVIRVAWNAVARGGDIVTIQVTEVLLTVVGRVLFGLVCYPRPEIVHPECE